MNLPYSFWWRNLYHMCTTYDLDTYTTSLRGTQGDAFCEGVNRSTFARDS